MLTRFMWAKSDCICCNRANACVRSSVSVSREYQRTMRSEASGLECRGSQTNEIRRRSASRVLRSIGNAAAIDCEDFSEWGRSSGCIVPFVPQFSALPVTGRNTRRFGDLRLRGHRSGPRSQRARYPVNRRAQTSLAFTQGLLSTLASSHRRSVTPPTARPRKKTGDGWFLKVFDCSIRK